MVLNTLRASLVATALLSFAGVAAAQPASVIGTVKSLTGGVVVQRGTETFTPTVGQQLLAGDRVMARQGSTVTITSPACDQTLASGSFIVMDAQFCVKSPGTLGAGTQASTGAGAGGGLGATPALLGLLVAGGGAAAAASSDNNSSSP